MQWLRASNDLAQRDKFGLGLTTLKTKTALVGIHEIQKQANLFIVQIANEIVGAIQLNHTFKHFLQ